MNMLPVVELRIRGMQEEVHHAIMLRQDEVAEQIKAGVDRALDRASDTIVEVATEEATKALKTQIENYFRYGAGYTAIKEAVEASLAPLTKALSTKPRSGGSSKTY